MEAVKFFASSGSSDVTEDHDRASAFWSTISHLVPRILNVDVSGLIGPKSANVFWKRLPAGRKSSTCIWWERAFNSAGGAVDREDTHSLGLKHNFARFLVGGLAKDGDVDLSRGLVVVDAALDELATDFLLLLGSDEEVLAGATSLDSHCCGCAVSGSFYSTSASSRSLNSSKSSVRCLQQLKPCSVVGDFSTHQETNQR